MNSPKEYVKTYNSQLDELFNEWEATLPEELKEKFCRDGLMLRPSGEDVNALWENSIRRVAFLLKDKSDNSCDDIRNWLVNEGDVNSEFCRKLKGGIIGKTGFLPNIARLLYGLLNVSIEKTLGFSDVKYLDVVKTWNEAPVALIETIKNAGCKNVSDAEMKRTIERDNELLKEELDILKANILVCCDSNDSQFEFVTDFYLKGKNHVKFEIEYPDVKTPCVYYYPEEMVAVIKSYHPTRSKGKPNWKVYERVVCTLRKLFEKYPEPFEKL
jgi:hypothetical protein